MNDQQHQLLSLADRLPARLTTEQVAVILNCQVHDIPVLVAARLLKPLGNPPANGIKFFAAAKLLELSQDESWLSRATNAIHQHWHRKNRRKHTNGASVRSAMLHAA